MNKELEEAEEAIEYFKKFTEYTKNRAIEEYKCENRNIQYAKDLEKRARIFETVLKHIDNSISKEVIEENINKYKEQLRNTTKRVVELQVLEQNRMLQKNEIEELSELLRDIDKIRAKIEVLEELLEGK